MSAWQMSLNKLVETEQYEKYLHHILARLMPNIKFPSSKKHTHKNNGAEIAETIILIIGTERGLCGRFNRLLCENALAWINENSISSYQIWALGTRMVLALERMGVTINWRKPFPSIVNSNFQHTYLTIQKWLSLFEKGAFNQFIVLFNQIERGDQYTFMRKQLFPFEMHQPGTGLQNFKENWPPPIIETDPQGIYHQIIDQYIASAFYRILLQSTAAEHASRYRLMEDAKENAQEIMKELKVIINLERKRKITQEMQELASGSGLLEK